MWVNAQDEVEGPSGRGTVNFIVRHKPSKRQGSISIISTAGYDIESNGQMRPIAVFDCRNVEPVGFVPGVRGPCAAPDGGCDARARCSLTLQHGTAGFRDFPTVAQDGFVATHTDSDRVFEVDLSDDWADFDDASGTPVTIFDVRSSFELQ